MSDTISRAAAIDAAVEAADEWDGGYSRSREEIITLKLRMLPSAQPERKKGEWTTEQVAELLANLFGDECSCNFSGIDEWLPYACKYSETTCPEPKEKHGCWMQFLLQGGADMRGEDE